MLYPLLMEKYSIKLESIESAIQNLKNPNNNAANVSPKGPKKYKTRVIESSIR